MELLLLQEFQRLSKILVNFTYHTMNTMTDITLENWHYFYSKVETVLKKMRLIPNYSTIEKSKIFAQSL